MNEKKSLVNYGRNEDIALLAERIKFMLPGGDRYTNNEAYMLAQLAIAYSLNPFNGECWIIKNQKTGKTLGALVGIKGLRKHAKRQSKYWGEGGEGGFKRILNKDRLKELGAGETDIVYTYEICDDHTQNKWLEGIERLRAVGFDQDICRDIMGQRPPTALGVGIYKTGESTKMQPVQCSMFRAEKDCLKRRFDVEFAVAGVSVGIADEALPNGDDPTITNGDPDVLDLEFDQDEPEFQSIHEDALPPMTEEYDKENGKMFK